MLGIDDLIITINQEVEDRVIRDCEKTFTIDLGTHKLVDSFMIQWEHAFDTIPFYDYTNHDLNVSYIVGLYLNVESYCIDVICTPVEYRGTHK